MKQGNKNIHLLKYKIPCYDDFLWHFGEQERGNSANNFWVTISFPFQLICVLLSNCQLVASNIVPIWPWLRWKRSFTILWAAKKIQSNKGNFLFRAHFNLFRDLLGSRIPMKIWHWELNCLDPSGTILNYQRRDMSILYKHDYISEMQNYVTTIFFLTLPLACHLIPRWVTPLLIGWNYLHIYNVCLQIILHIYDTAGDNNIFWFCDRSKFLGKAFDIYKCIWQTHVFVSIARPSLSSDAN